MSDIGVVGVVTSTTASSTTQTSAAPPSTSGILSATSSTSQPLSAPSSTSETLSSLPTIASPTNESTSHISGGAIAGVGFGVLASLLIGMTIIQFYRYYTRHHQSLQPNTSQESLSAKLQALNALGADTHVPRTTSNLGWMPRELPISGSIHTQQELPASGIPEMQQIGSSKTHHTARSPKSDLK